MASGSREPDGIGYPVVIEVEDDPHDEDMGINIPAIYQRVVLRRPGDYSRDYEDELEEEDPDDDDFDLTAPPLES